MLTNLLFVGVILSLSISLLYGIWFRYALNLYNQPKQPPQIRLLPVTVIITCKNEENNISTVVSQILSQDYPDFELIVIDDFSNDKTLENLHSFRDLKLIVLSADENIPGKKKALSQAIHAAKNELILLTDADCSITSKLWIQSMAMAMIASPQIEIVIGISPMSRNHNLVNLFSRFETILTAIQYSSYTLSGIPYMAVGRNLMYKKSLFHRIGGFQNHIDIASGDDDLLIQQGANKTNTVVNLESESFVYTTSKESITSFLRQKSRHITTAPHFKLIHKVLLFVFAFSQMFFYAGAITGVLTGIFALKSILFLLFIKWILQILLLYKWFEKLQSLDMLIFIPILDILLVKYYFILPIYKAFSTKKNW